MKKSDIMAYKNTYLFLKFIAIITMIAGLSIGTTPFMNTAMSEVWYVVLAYLFAGCTVASGVILFITAKFEVSK